MFTHISDEKNMNLFLNTKKLINLISKTNTKPKFYFVNM